MNTRILLACAAAAFAAPLEAQPAPEVPLGPPSATIDLATDAGVRMVRAEWRTHDARIVEIDFRSPGPDGKPTGAPNRTYDIEPRAGAAGFDDSAWPVIAPASLVQRRSTGKVCFAWYRIAITVPERIGGVDPTGSTLVFDTVVDDYAEVWVDGALPRELGRDTGNLVQGWNVPNRLVVGRDVRPGQRIQLAVFAMNGPISDPPSNYIWVRSARLEVHTEPRAFAPRPVETEIVRVDAGLDAIVPRGARIEKLAEGFQFTEGPVWLREGALLFSDPNRNRIYRWTPDNRVVVSREQSGYSGADVAEYRQPGSNGLTLDSWGRLTICEHGNRRVSRLEPDGGVTVIADRYEGKRINSPNDLVYASDGTLYFTDPPFGLPKFHADPRRELPFTGVFSLQNGTLRLASRDFEGPNGLALSPDEKFLYVANWDEKKKIVTRYETRRDGTLAAGRIFFDMTSAPGEEALDGLKVDRSGNVYVSGPGGVWILSPEGRHLGTIRGPELPANFAWGDGDARTLYLCARTGLYRIRLNIPGIRPEGEPATTSTR